MHRRNALAGAFLALSVGGANATRRAPLKPTKATRAAAWLLGDDLSLAALLHAGGSTEGPAQDLFRKATTIAGQLGLIIQPLPPRASGRAGALVATVSYLLKGEGAALAAALRTRLGADHEVLFDLAARTNLLIVLYNPAEDAKLGPAIELRCKQVGFPPELWRGLVTAIGQKQSEAAIKEQIARMHRAVAVYLVTQSK